jgi:threonine dehydratase
MKGALDGETVQCGGATLAEGIAVKNVGKLTLEIVRARVDDILLVDEATIEQAVNAYLTQQKTMAEGAGAAGLAALLSTASALRGAASGW